MIRSAARSTAATDALWSVVADIEAWPAHLPTFDSITPAGESGGDHPGLGPGVVGRRYEVRQPGLPAATYEVTEWTPGTSFTWVARSPGVVTTATHTVTSTADGSRLELTIDWSGPLSAFVRLLLGRKAQQMIDSEATTLARLAER